VTYIRYKYFGIFMRNISTHT